MSVNYLFYVRTPAKQLTNVPLAFHTHGKWKRKYLTLPDRKWPGKSRQTPTALWPRAIILLSDCLSPSAFGMETLALFRASWLGSTFKSLPQEQNSD